MKSQHVGYTMTGKFQFWFNTVNALYSANRTGVETLPCLTPHNTGNRKQSIQAGYPISQSSQFQNRQKSYYSGQAQCVHVRFDAGSCKSKPATNVWHMDRIRPFLNSSVTIRAAKFVRLRQAAQNNEKQSWWIAAPANCYKLFEYRANLPRNSTPLGRQQLCSFQ